MRLCYSLLAGALLAACAPTDVSTTPPGATEGQRALASIPARFQGSWTPHAGGEHPPGGENPTVIKATSWQGHESYGQVESVQIHGENEITVTLAMSGEGEQWVDRNRLQLSPDGNAMTVTGSRRETPWTLYRVR